MGGVFRSHHFENDLTSLRLAGCTNILDGRVAVITGAVRGIGRAVDVALTRSIAVRRALTSAGPQIHVPE